MTNNKMVSTIYGFVIFYLKSICQASAQRLGELLLRLPFQLQLIKSPIRLNTDMVDWLNG